MRLSRDRDDRVFGNRETSGLQPFLQSRLRILGKRRGIEVREFLRVDRLDRLSGRVETTVDEHRTEYRFQRIGKDRRPRRTTAAQFAFSQPY